MNKALKRLAILAGAVSLPAMTAMLFSPPPVSGSTMGDGAAIYKGKCAMCHGADGSGDTAVGKKLGLRDLRSAPVQGQSDTQLFQVIAKGKGKMPAFEKSLGADQIRDVVAYLRQLGRR